MRRLVLTIAALGALAVPAAAAASTHGLGAGDGTLVIKNADNGDGIGPKARPVATLVVTGFVIGRIGDQGRIQIFDIDPTDQGTPEVTGAGGGAPVVWQSPAGGQSFTGTQWSGDNLRFRAVGGTYRIVIWGSGVYVFSSGHGKVMTTGNPADPSNDGQFSLDGGDFSSLSTQSILLGS